MTEYADIGAVYVGEGALIDYYSTAALTAGDVVVQGDLVGIVVKDIPATSWGVLAIEGIFDIPKAVLSTSAISAGAKVYWDSGNELASAAADSFKQIGKSTLGATAADTTVRVKLIP